MGKTGACEPGVPGQERGRPGTVTGRLRYLTCYFRVLPETATGMRSERRTLAVAPFRLPVR